MTPDAHIVRLEAVAEAARAWASADYQLAQVGEAPNRYIDMATEVALEDEMNLAEIAIRAALARLEAT